MNTFNEKLIFVPVTQTRKKCPRCNKIMIDFFNEKYEIGLNICSDKLCGYHEGFDYLELDYVDLDLNNVTLIGYFDE